MNTPKYPSDILRTSDYDDLKTQLISLIEKISQYINGDITLTGLEIEIDNAKTYIK